MGRNLYPAPNAKPLKPLIRDRGRERERAGFGSIFEGVSMASLKATNFDENTPLAHFNRERERAGRRGVVRVCGLSLSTTEGTPTQIPSTPALENNRGLLVRIRLRRVISTEGIERQAGRETLRGRERCGGVSVHCSAVPALLAIAHPDGCDHRETRTRIHDWSPSRMRRLPRRPRPPRHPH